MVVFPNVKINLGLFVIEKRLDGFHNIETVMVPVPMHDALEMVVSRNETFDFHITGIEIPGNPHENLCYRAWEMLQKDFDLPPVSLHLHKATPIGAGLGGGSSDGAFTIKLINQLFELGLTTPMMEDYAKRLGSDCAFFINNQPVFAFEKGDRLEPISLDLSDTFIVIAKPDVHISTQEAYKGIRPAPSQVSLKEALHRPLKYWREQVTNDFEHSIFKAAPVVGQIKSKLYEQGAVFALMSGSGSAVYGLFEYEVDLKEQFQDCFYWSGWLG